MTSVKRIMLAGLFIVPVLLVQSVWASLDVFLPVSSYYYGRTYSYSSTYPENRMRVDYAVYDTLGGNEFADAGFAAPGDEQYTYVYQVFNDIDDDDFSIDLFRIFGIEPEAISGNYQISSEDDQEGGIDTLKGGSGEELGAYFNPSKTNGIWEFEQGVLINGEHSYFLVISSDYDYVPGYWSTLIDDPANEVSVPGTQNPEPATMILFGIGSVILMARRKDSVVKSR